MWDVLRARRQNNIRRKDLMLAFREGLFQLLVKAKKFAIAKINPSLNVNIRSFPLF